MALGTTLDALVERVRRDALLASRGAVYTLGAAYTAGGTTLTLNETPTHIGQGSILSIDYELFYVQSVAPGTKQATVIGAYFGSTAADHSENAIIEVDSRFPKVALADYAEQEVRSWGTKLWAVDSVEIDITRTTRSYELSVTGDIIYLLDVRLEPSGETSNFYDFSWTGDAWAHADARLLREMPASASASGYTLQLARTPGRATTARVAMAVPLDLSTFTDSTDLVTDVGCKPEWLDIIELGARYRALSTVAIGRSDWRTGSMARNAEEVSTFDVMRTTQQAQGMRDLRFAEEVTNLRAAWPYRS